MALICHLCQKEIGKRQYKFARKYEGSDKWVYIHGKCARKETEQKSKVTPDPLRTALTELLQPVPVDDAVILDRVRYLLNCEKALGTWREKGIPF